MKFHMVLIPIVLMPLICIVMKSLFLDASQNRRELEKYMRQREKFNNINNYQKEKLHAMKEHKQSKMVQDFNEKSNSNMKSEKIKDLKNFPVNFIKDIEREKRKFNKTVSEKFISTTEREKPNFFQDVQEISMKNTSRDRLKVIQNNSINWTEDPKLKVKPDVFEKPLIQNKYEKFKSIPKQNSRSPHKEPKINHDIPEKSMYHKNMEHIKPNVNKNLYENSNITNSIPKMFHKKPTAQRESINLKKFLDFPKNRIIFETYIKKNKSAPESLIKTRIPIVTTFEGKFSGRKEIIGQVRAITFRGVPFARPPIANLRFKPPVPAGKFTGVYRANDRKNAISCKQPNGEGSEDCLYLNVYAPKRASTDGGLPVMVFLHAGGFTVGSPNIGSGVGALLSRGVIVVCPGYRLGVLGFLSTEDDVAPGNLGLMDQTLALKWVKRNIAAFGGNVNRITLFGFSAGSASTHYQMLIPQARGLFSAAIMMSGTALDPWARGFDFFYQSQDIGKRFNCPLSPSTALIQCLQNVSAGELSRITMGWNNFILGFGPRVDGTFIPDEPESLLKSGRFSKVPTIVGGSREEWAHYARDLLKSAHLRQNLNEDFSKFGPTSLALPQKYLSSARRIYNHYLGGTEITNSKASQLTKMYSHAWFLIPQDWVVQLHGSLAPTYHFEYSHQGSQWATHSDYIGNVFMNEKINFTATNKSNKRIFITLFTNFAKFRKPTRDSTLLGFSWQNSSRKFMQHLSITNEPHYSMKEDGRRSDRQFWESLSMKISKPLRSVSYNIFKTENLKS